VEEGMDFVLVMVALIGFCGLALAFGRDSRDEVISKEHALAVLGMTWESRPARVSRAVAPAGKHVVRHRLAGGLYRLANWLQPAGTESSTQTSPRLQPGA
jgi:hypothetical protein